jgi:hypothetical protein
VIGVPFPERGALADHLLQRHGPMVGLAAGARSPLQLASNRNKEAP